MRSFAAAALAVVVLWSDGCEESSGGDDGPPLSSAADSLVSEWNETAMMLGPNLGTFMATRAVAMMHAAIYDTVAAFDGGHLPYHVTDTPPAGASPRAAAASAAYHVLTAAYTNPDHLATIRSRYDGQLAQVEDGAGKEAGIAFGRGVAEAFVALRASDGCLGALEVEHPDGVLPGEWRRTSSGEPLAPGWGEVRPWAMTTCGQFDQGGPPPLSGHEYAEAYEEVRQLGEAGSTLRTAEQSAIATFWEPHVPAKWAGLARTVAREQELSLMESARLFALVSVTVADAAIAAWNMKFRYNFWRPESAVHLADDDTNDETLADAAWEPFLASPAFPEYVSGHSLTSAAAAAILGRYLGSDHYHFELSAMHGGEPRAYDSFTAAAEEAGQSRIWAGIHFQFSNRQALQAGAALGEFVFTNLFRPR
jgi:hypothetical protein